MSEIFPIRYVNPVFRPPSEADSLILPVTNGCSWNKCTYCEMYTAPQKKFAVRDEQETLDAIRNCGEQFAGQVQRVFIGDGDAMVLSTRRLMTAAVNDQSPPAQGAAHFQLLPAAQSAPQNRAGTAGAARCRFVAGVCRRGVRRR